MNWPREFIDEGNKILSRVQHLNITPGKNAVLNFLKIDPNKIKVVIVGQDPYPAKNVATGYAFAVSLNQRTPLSLVNIFEEIRQVQDKVYADQTLRFWIDQGVLLLNRSLTTIVGQSNVHKQIWHQYTENVIKWLDQNFQVIWVLWGKKAQQIACFVKGQKVMDAHPSPFSNHLRNKQTFKVLSFIKW